MRSKFAMRRFLRNRVAREIGVGNDQIVAVAHGDRSTCSTSAFKSGSTPFNMLVLLHSSGPRFSIFLPCLRIENMMILSTSGLRPDFLSRTEIVALPKHRHKFLIAMSQENQCFRSGWFDHADGCLQALLVQRKVFRTCTHDKRCTIFERNLLGSF